MRLEEGKYGGKESTASFLISCDRTFAIDTWGSFNNPRALQLSIWISMATAVV